MSKVALFWIFALSSFCAPVFADWISDANQLDGTVTVGQPQTQTFQTINSFKTSTLDPYQPPPPCVDTSSSHQWQLGSPASLTCTGGSAGSGGGTAGSSGGTGGASSSSQVLQQTQPSDNSGIMY